jgi:hypothetical protein
VPEEEDYSKIPKEKSRKFEDEANYLESLGY